MHQISPQQLWIGHAGDGRAYRELLDRGIRVVVQLALEEAPTQPPREIAVLRIPLLDGAGNESFLISLAINSVAALIRQNVPTLICCSAGMSRSPAIIAAAVSLVQNVAIDECLRSISAHHPADVSPGLWDEIVHARSRVDTGR